MTLEDAITRAFCSTVRMQAVPAGLAVGTGFCRSDGDGIGFYVVRDGDGYRIEDDGSTLPLIEASGLSLSKGTRARAFQNLLAEYDVDYDEDDAELRTPRLPLENVPAAAMKFTALLLRLQDFALLHPETVHSTFRDDAVQEIRQKFGAVADIQVDAPVTDALSLYPADVVLRKEGRAPLGVFLAASDKRILEAVVARMVAKHEAHADCRIMALIDSPKSLTDKGWERAANGLDAVAMFRHARPAAMSRIGDLLM